MYESKKAKEGGRTSKAVKNIGLNIANQCILLVLSLINRTIFIHYLGIDYLGINSLFSDVLGLLSMADLGLNTAMVYSFYKPLADHDEEKIVALITFYRKLYIIIALAISVMGICIVPFLPHIISLNYEVEYLTIYYLISLSNIVASYLFIYKTSLLIADQKNYVVVKVNIVSNILKTLCQIGVLIVVRNYVVYLIIATVFTILSNVISSSIATEQYKFINEERILSSEEKKDIFRNIGSVFIYKVSSTLINATDNLLISILVGTVAVGYYANYLLVQNKIVSIFALVFTSVTACVGNLIVTENENRRYQIFKEQQVISFILSGVVVPTFIAVINDFITIWVGKSFLFDFKIVLVITLNLYLNCVLQPLWSYREAAGVYKKTKWIMVACAVENLILSILLGKNCGIAGIILASSISRLTTYFWYEPKILFEKFFGRDSIEYFCDILKNFVVIVMLAVISCIVGSYISSETIMGLVIKTGVIFMINMVVSMGIYSKTEGAKLITRRIILYIKGCLESWKNV